MTSIDPYTATSVGADSISATEQNDSRQVRRSMTSIDPYSNPRMGGFHIRPHYAVPRMQGAASSTPRNTQHTHNIKEHP